MRKGGSPAEELLSLLQTARYRSPEGLEEPAVSGALTLDATGVLARVGAPWGVLARGLSCEAGGLWMAGEESLTWVNGRRVASLVAAGNYERVRSAREALHKAGLEVTAWTIGGCARQGLSWVGHRTIPRKGSVDVLLAGGWAWHSWVPGCYAEAGLFDLEAAYYNAVRRLPSPDVDYLPDGPCWHPLPKEARARWRELLTACGTSKPLRLCLVGCMYGSGHGCATWHKGQRVAQRRVCGPFKVGALLAIRAVRELCGLAAVEEGAVWSHTDAVILPADRRPRAWERYGYRYREEARGEAEVVHSQVYRVGDKQTVAYRAGARYPLPAYQPSVPSPLTLASWH